MGFPLQTPLPRASGSSSSPRANSAWRWLPALCSLLILLMTACGWQPRGAFVNTDQLGKIYIEGSSNDPIGKALRRDISAAGGELTSFRADADHIVWVGNTQRENRDASYDVLIRTVEKEIVMRAVFEVRSADGERIYGPEMIYAERVYKYDVQGVTSTAAQVAVIEDELKENIGHQIAQRLSSLQPGEKQADDGAEAESPNSATPTETETEGSAIGPEATVR